MTEKICQRKAKKTEGGGRSQRVSWMEQSNMASVAVDKEILHYHEPASMGA